MKSGISDYSEILIYGLKDYFDITLVIDAYKLDNKNLYKDFEVIVYSKNKIDFTNFDHILYNIGNNPYFHSYIYELALHHPGMVILHDYILYFLSIGYYSNKDNLYAKVFEMEGARGISILKDHVKKNTNLLTCKDIASALPLNREIINSSNGILVHSEYTKRLLAEHYPEKNVHKIEMVNMVRSSYEHDKDYLKKKYGINDNVIVIGSFGYVSQTKLNHLICEVVAELAKSTARELYYVMVGDGDYVDRYLGKNIIRTGFVERTIYDAILERCDIVANLRYPTMGETSISLIHAMGMGKPCLVTNYAWFAELPDNAVIKIDINNMKHDLFDKIDILMQNRDAMTNYANNAKDFIFKKHSIQKTAREIKDLLQGIG